MSSRLVLIGAAAAALLFGLSFAGFKSAKGEESDAKAANAEFSTAQEDAIRDVVREFIRENPEFVIETLNDFARSQQLASIEEATALALPTLLSSEGGFVAKKAKGEATVAVIEFFDYHCGFCKRANGVVQDLTKDDPAVQVVFRELPILREESQVAASFALAARDQDKYVDLHFAMMGAKGVIDEDRAIKIADKLGLDVQALKRRADAPDIVEELTLNREIARDLGFDGTPSFIVTSLKGDYMEIIPGFDKEALLKAIKEAKDVS